jgi:23S rRNA (pseudouridine1915-N3)-methyltransferase
MHILFLFGGGKFDTETAPLFEHFLTRVKRYYESSVLLISSDHKHDDALYMKYIKPDDYVLVCDERGKTLTSPQLAVAWENMLQSGKKRVVVIVGGAFGVGDTVRSRAQLVLSLSSLIFPHQLARIIALEQTYRALSILSGSKYHHEG